LQKAEDGVNTNLDLIVFLRRIRQHGVALTCLLKSEDKAFIAKFAKSKCIETYYSGPRHLWNQVENLSYPERIATGVLAHFHKNEMKKEREGWFADRIKNDLKKGILEGFKSIGKVATRQGAEIEEKQ